MKYDIKTACVIGAGVMGGAIAAHLANAGIKVNLLDIVPQYTDKDKENGVDKDSIQFRNRLVDQSLKNLLKMKPAPLYSKSFLNRIKGGNLEDNLDMITEADWIIEVVVESLKIKHIVFKTVQKYRKKGAILTSNTSGLSIKDMMKPFKDDKDFISHFMVTHFFNPVRYMKLLELVDGKYTSKDVSKAIADFGSKKLGKGIVYGKDTPNFIANRIGVYAMMKTVNYALDMDLKLGAVDKIMGPATGRPRSAVFRTGDLVGIDVLVHATDTVYDNAIEDDEREVFKVPKPILKLVENGWVGSKVKKGFYEKRGKEIYAINLKTFEYEPNEKPKFKSLKKGKAISNVGKRVKAILNYKDKNGESDIASQYSWLVFRDLLTYSVKKLGEIADDVLNIDNAMKWGFNWEIGPFETWDALGIKETVERLKGDNIEIPEKIEQLLKYGDTFYREIDGVKHQFDFNKNSYVPIEQKKEVLYLKPLKKTVYEIYKNPSASIYNIGDGVLCLEFHTKMNAIDEKIMDAQFKALELVEMKSYKGLVISNQGEHFSAGANLMQVLMAVNQKQWKKLEEMIEKFQYANKAIKYAKFPVVVAPHGYTFGGGCEVTMHGTHNRVLGETYLGLVETGVGLIPAGGGTKELLFRNAKKFNKINRSKVADGYPYFWTMSDRHISGPMFYIVKSFENIGMVKIATSGIEAIETGYLTPENTKLTTNKDLLLSDAKADVLKYSENFIQAKEDVLYLPGADTVQTAIKMNLEDFDLKGLVTPHDKTVATELAYVMGGGDTTYSKAVTEDRLLELEREIFLKLLGMQPTKDRILHMLNTGKPLRN